ncbi:MAG: hypothetical protein WD208_09080 [Dehalococcoidia bacterium]
MIDSMIRASIGRIPLALIRKKGCPRNESLPEDLVQTVDMLAAVHKPTLFFVEALGQRLENLHVEYEQKSPNPVRILWRPSWALRGVGVLVLMAVAVTLAMLPLVMDNEGPDVVSADVITESVEALLGLNTVRYEAQTSINHGTCFSGFNTPLTSDEKASLGGASISDTGIVYGCSDGQQLTIENGVYDLADGDFSGATQWIQRDGDFRAVDLGGRDLLTRSTERVFADGQLYTREGDGEWMLNSTSNIWRPFTFEGAAQVPIGTLQSLQSGYDEVLKLGIESVDGEELIHYKARRMGSSGPETVETWIGADDGLPRKAVVVLETDNSEEQFVQSIRNNLESDPAFTEFADAPIVRRGEWPSTSVITYTYTFTDFNEVVAITAPR